MPLKLSILIASLNDNAECDQTVRSIRQTAGEQPEIIVIDDQSDQPLRLTDPSPRTVVLRNKERIGCAPSRHLAAEMATGHTLLITDSHMRFEPGWYEAAEERVGANPDAFLCGACLGLNEKHMDVTKPIGVYSGATLNFYGPDRNNSKLMQVFEGVWKDHEDKAEIPCMMGACYFMPREAFFVVGGLSQLKMWGIDEPYLSVKAWLAGYRIVVAKNVRIGHQFRHQAPYRTQVWTMIYNKVRAILTLFKEDESIWLLRKLRELTAPPQWDLAMEQIKRDKSDIVRVGAYYQKLFKHDLGWLCERFKIPYPITAS